ncbi:MAG TPA: nitroreductase family protein [Gammaproteobacteria bacterium]|nr:nitroreductase family protein [Gammaproteobacteria bacterium]
MSRPAAKILDIQLPPPDSGSTDPVLAALRSRRTTRDISGESLAPRQLSDLLWAAWGVNRKQGPFGDIGRTAASASNSQEIDLYVALADGTYLYDAMGHRLLWVSDEDLRTQALTPEQKGFSAVAGVQLIYVADLGRLTHTRGFDEPGLHDPEVQKAYYYVDTGLIAGNVYLFAAAVGLAAWFHNCDRARLTQALRLKPSQRALFAQSVGYPGLDDDK